MSGLSDDDIDEMAGDGACTHLPQVCAALEIRHTRALVKRLEAWAMELDGRCGGPIPPEQVAAELRGCMHAPDEAEGAGKRK